MTDWNGTASYTYDDAGRTASVTDAGGQTLSYTWTKTGRKQSIRYPDGKSAAYVYDPNGRLTKVTDTDGGVTAYAYDAAGRRISKKLPNGAASEYAWDAKGQFVERIETGRGGGLANGAKTSYRYEYDADGNQSVTTRCAYDGFGNRIRKTVKRDGKTTAECHYTTDWTSAYGNSICIKETVTGNTRLFTYGEEILAVSGGEKTEYYRTNEQQTVTETHDASGDVMAAYAYDEFGVLTEVRTPETKTAEAEKALETGKGNGRDLEKAQSQQTEPTNGASRADRAGG